MRKKYWMLLLASTIACAGLAVACGDDDDNPTTPPVEAGLTETGPIPEGGPLPDGGDAGCTFASYVIGLINTQTTAGAQPDKTLGAGCTDTTDQAAFKPLFP